LEVVDDGAVEVGASVVVVEDGSATVVVTVGDDVVVASAPGSPSPANR
jgi:hypothetical protein